MIAREIARLSPGLAFIGADLGMREVFLGLKTWKPPQIFGNDGPTNSYPKRCLLQAVPRNQGGTVGTTATNYVEPANGARQGVVDSRVGKDME